MDHSSSGARPIHCAQAPKSAAAAAQGNSSVKSASGRDRRRGEVERGDDAEVAPAAAPARPVEVGFAARVGREHARVGGDDGQRLDGVAVRPYLRPSTPTPPPSASPAMPTLGQLPPGTRTPAPASAL